MATVAVAAAERPLASDGARVSIFWVLLAVAAGVFVLAHDISYGVNTWTMDRGYGTLGYLARDRAPDGFWKITAIRPGGPAAAAGWRLGDEVRPDQAGDAFRYRRSGETLGFTLRRAGATSHEEIKTTAYEPRAEDRATVQPLLVPTSGALLTCLFGLLVTLRSRSRAALLFGAALATLAFIGDPTSLESDPLVFQAFVIVRAILEYGYPVLFLAYALAARRETRGPVARAWWIVLAACAAAQAALMGWSFWALLGTGLAWHDMVPGILADHPLIQAGIAGQAVGFALTFLVLGLAWRESHGRERTRYGFMLLAGLILTLSFRVTPSLINLTGAHWTLSNPLLLFIPIGSTIGSGVFAYAVLRHRVLDLGFAVNRTLVYTVVSAILLAAFGLIEWAVDHFVPIGGRENNALVDAAVAVGVFLTFHRVRDGVEHVIEGLFFRRWQRAEVQLRRFVKEAAFATRSETLTRGLAAALIEYAEGADAAVHLLGQDGAFHRSGGRLAGVGEALDPDDSALMAIRAEPKALAPEQAGSALKAALVAPMVNRNEVIGVALLGPKPSGLDFRPDEIELIGWATRQVGLDLHALKVERLEAREADLLKTVAVLEHALSLKSATV